MRLVMMPTTLERARMLQTNIVGSVDILYILKTSDDTQMLEHQAQVIR